MTRECGHNRSQHPPPVFSPACSLSLQWLDSLDPAQLAALAALESPTAEAGGANGGASAGSIKRTNSKP